VVSDCFIAAAGSFVAFVVTEQELPQQLLHEQSAVAKAHLRFHSIELVQQLFAELEVDAPLVGTAPRHTRPLMPSEVIGLEAY
jgi:hypothetical protein